jgi:hypothetical protein
MNTSFFWGGAAISIAVASPHLRALLAARCAWLIVCAGRAAVFMAIGAQLMGSGTQPAMAQEVSGIYTESATKDLGDVTKKDWLKGLKVRGWLETYIEHNFNDPDAAVVNANQGLSVVKARDLKIEGRTFDVRSDSFRLLLAELEVEKVPERNRVGFKLDVAYGDTQNIIFDTVRLASPGSVRGLDRIIQHASISYLAPIGKGLRFDVGKFVTHIGAETIEGIKNRNFSHTYFYTYGIPFQDTGLRVNYAFSPKVYAEFYAVKGWNVTFDNNSGKTFGLTLGYAPSSKFRLTANYLGGPERNNNSRDRRDLYDFQFIYSPAKTLQIMINVDIGRDENAVAPGRNAKWGGVTLYVRKDIDGRFFPTLRAEYYGDPQGLTTKVAQRVGAYTFTGDFKMGKKNGFVKHMLRPELRFDMSDAPFFSHNGKFRSRKQQLTFGIGFVSYF